jgi:hypothetical protein
VDVTALLARLDVIEGLLRGGDNTDGAKSEASDPEEDLLDRLDPRPRTLVRFHLVMMLVWIALLPPTVVWWKESILWVATMSLYANFVGHFSGWDAARAESKADDSV